MSLPNNIPELAIPVGAPADAQEQARCLRNAADLVEDFARKSGAEALDVLLAATLAQPGEAVPCAGELAASMAAQAETLEAEVARFLSLTKNR